MTKSEYHKVWSSKNQDKLKANRLRWLEKNQERMKLLRKRWVSENPVKDAESKRKWASGPGKEYKKAYREQNKARLNKACADWYQANKHRPEFRAKVALYAAKYRKRNRAKLYAKFNRRSKILKERSDGTADAFIVNIRLSEIVTCAYCGFVMRGSDAHIDHIIPLSRGGLHSASNLCPSCCRCNLIKGDKLLSELSDGWNKANN
jgi:5-methylcytosine-specific restriction endonuclease McrA